MSSEPFDQPAGLGDRLDDLLLRVETWAAGRRGAVVAAGALILAGAAAWWGLTTGDAEPAIEESIPVARPELDAGSGSEPGVDPPDEQPADLVVHVVGAVQTPGLGTLTPGARISDAVAAAGGGTAEADLARLNLASPVVDGMQIRVPAIDEEAPVGGSLVQLPPFGDDQTAPGDSTTTEPIDLNRADEAELQALPGIGPALAARIVTWRTENGGFATVDDLESVPGIGPAKLAELRDRVVV